MLKKILIVFDTNKIRQGDGEGATEYSKFRFAGDFKTILDHISEKKLEGHVSIAVPEICIEEIKRQKIESYEDDFKSLDSVKKRVEGIEKITVLSEVKEDFSINDHLEALSQDFMEENKNITILRLEEEKYSEIFKKIIKRALDKEPPFKDSGKASDAGFKDVLIWETVLNSDFVNNFDEVIFLSNDGWFDGSKCKKEFEDRLNKYCKVMKETRLLIEDLDMEYEDIDIVNDFTEFSKNEYFPQLLVESVAAGKYVLETDEDIDVKGMNVNQVLPNVEIIKGQDENMIGISSEVVINPGTDDLLFKAYAMLNEEKEIIEIHLSKL